MLWNLNSLCHPNYLAAKFILLTFIFTSHCCIKGWGWVGVKTVTGMSGDQGSFWKSNEFWEVLIKRFLSFQVYGSFKGLRALINLIVGCNIAVDFWSRQNAATNSGWNVTQQLAGIRSSVDCKSQYTVGFMFGLLLTRIQFWCWLRI